VADASASKTAVTARSAAKQLRRFTDGSLPPILLTKAAEELKPQDEGLWSEAVGFEHEARGHRFAPKPTRKHAR
jgi:hypothetical protein